MAEIQKSDTGTLRSDINENFGSGSGQPITQLPIQGDSGTDPRCLEPPDPSFQPIRPERKQVTNIAELIADQDALRRWDAEQDNSVKELVLTRLSPEYAKSDKAIQAVISSLQTFSDQ